MSPSPDLVRGLRSELERQLARMDEGSYGICTTCGEEIQEGRLFVMPEAEHCPECAGPGS